MTRRGSVSTPRTAAAFLLCVLSTLISCSDSPAAHRADGVRNLALGAQVIASERGPGGGLAAVLDGDTGTGWIGPVPPYWVEIDLGEQVQIASVRLLPGTSGLVVSHVNVGVHDNPGRRPGSRVGPVEAGAWIEVEVGYEARFVRLAVDEAEEAMSWLEIEVMG